MTTTTWNPSDLSGITLSAFTLAGANIANVVAIATAQGGVRAVTGSTIGKYYFEYQLQTFSSGNTGIGIVNASAALTNVGPVPTNACFVYPSGTVWLNNVSSSRTIGAISSGSIVGVALDLNTNQIWMRICPSGNWFNVATNNPATNVGGLSITSITGGNIFPAFGSGVSGEKVTANFGDTGAFFGAVPSGFIAGYPVAGVPPPTSGLLTQIATEEWAINNPQGLMTQIAIEQWASVAGSASFSARHV